MRGHPISSHGFDHNFDHPPRLENLQRHSAVVDSPHHDSYAISWRITELLSTRHEERFGKLRLPYKAINLSPEYLRIESYLRKRFKTKQDVYPSEVADSLGLDYELVREIIAKMMDEGKLESA